MNRKHIFFYKLVRPLVIVFLKCTFGYRFTMAKNLPKQYLVISNHVTDYDPLLVTCSFPNQMYYVGSEHISRWKLAYTLLKACFAPIMRPKGASAASTVIDIIRHVKKGASVCLFAEGVRSWDGRSCPIDPSTAKMVKKLGCGLVTYRIVGGYFASPMWSGASIRRGYLHGGVVRVFTPEQLKEMTAEEIYAAILEDTREDAYARQLANPKPYRSKAPAEHLERLLFLCPRCGGRDTFSSKGDTVTCSGCGHAFRYTEYGMLEGTDFETVQAFSDWQNQQVELNTAAGTAYTSPSAALSVIDKHMETPLTSGPLTLSPAGLSCGTFSVPLEEISDLAMFGQKNLVFTANKTYYQLTPSEGSNCLKFLLYYQSCKHTAKIAR